MCRLPVPFHPTKVPKARFVSMKDLQDPGP
jgi:hypothetical protein